MSEPEKRPRKQEQEPASDEVTEVAPGVLRMQLPIQMPGLGHVNCYALVDDRGATLVDPGLPDPRTWKRLRQRLAQADLRVDDVHTVVVTHSHIDHFGAAGRLAETAGADFVGHADFEVPFLGVRRHHVAGEAAPERTKPDWNEPTPWGGRPLRPPRGRRVAFWAMRRIGRSLKPPVPSRRVVEGEPLKLAGREWFTLHTPGHTLDHLCLHDPEEGVLLSGDHVLPTITPHISGVGNIGVDPLRDFVESLDRVGGLDGVGTVLPAHGHPFHDLAGRVDSIKRHHEERLERIRQIAAEIGRPATVADVSQRLFRRARWGPMAESETYAHLEHLRLAGQAECSRRPDGVVEYEVESPRVDAASA